MLRIVGGIAEPVSFATGVAEAQAQSRVLLFLQGGRPEKRIGHHPIAGSVPMRGHRLESLRRAMGEKRDPALCRPREGALQRLVQILLLPAGIAGVPPVPAPDVRPRRLFWKVISLVLRRTVTAWWIDFQSDSAIVLRGLLHQSQRPAAAERIECREMQQLPGIRPVELLHGSHLIGK